MKLLIDKLIASGQASDAMLESLMPRSYNVTKAAIIILTRSLARQLGNHNIRVNAIAPGSTDTEMIHTYLSEDDLRGFCEKEIPLNRMAEPSEIAGAALFLASGVASYVTGHTLVADGGFLA